jgi:nucleotide-binding universal stress UspA family protein
MYRSIVLAYDGTREGRSALREGALLAKACGSKIVLLSVVAETAGLQIGESALPGALLQEQDAYRAILQEGADRLKALGFDFEARLVQGEPTRVIAAVAADVGADLVVLGHRKRGALARWWSGSTGAYLLDHVGCSILVARDTLTDEAFAAAFARAQAPAGAQG